MRCGYSIIEFSGSRTLYPVLDRLYSCIISALAPLSKRYWNTSALDVLKRQNCIEFSTLIG